MDVQGRSSNAHEAGLHTYKRPHMYQPRLRACIAVACGMQCCVLSQSRWHAGASRAGPDLGPTQQNRSLHCSRCAATAEPAKSNAQPACNRRMYPSEANCQFQLYCTLTPVGYPTQVTKWRNTQPSTQPDHTLTAAHKHANFAQPLSHTPRSLDFSAVPSRHLPAKEFPAPPH